jgi:hypothetical protein
VLPDTFDFLVNLIDYCDTFEKVLSQIGNTVLDGEDPKDSSSCK